MYEKLGFVCDPDVFQELAMQNELKAPVFSKAAP